MKICFPVEQDEGLESRIYNHFGSAPLFVLVDADARTVSVITNGDQHHAHGVCNPLKALNSQMLDAVVVGGIGGGALSRLNQAGVKVYRAEAPTIAQNLSLLESKGLSEFILQDKCGGHGHGGQCAH